MSKKELIRRLQISCLGLDPIDPLRLLVNDVIEALEEPQRTWIGLTDREIDELWILHHDDFGNPLSATGYERAIEAKLKEKNT